MVSYSVYIINVYGQGGYQRSGVIRSRTRTGLLSSDSGDDITADTRRMSGMLFAIRAAHHTGSDQEIREAKGRTSDIYMWSAREWWRWRRARSL